MVHEPNNWGRFGPEDQRGTLNLLTGPHVLAALSHAVTGEVLSLGMPIRRGRPRLPGRPEPQHYMSIDGADFAAGTRPVGAGLRMADDTLIVSPHGTTTHLDALCHMWSGDELYNGHPAAQVHSYGARRCGIEHVGGVVTRGVFFDVPAYLGLDHLPADFRISATLLTEMAEHPGAGAGGAELAGGPGGTESHAAAGGAGEAAGPEGAVSGGVEAGPPTTRGAAVAVGPGDAVVIRTGWPQVWDRSPDAYSRDGQPGLAADAARWLTERDVAVVACDNAAIGGLNPQGLADEPLEDDLHLILLHRHGIHLAELLWLEDLAATGRTEFVFVLAPLRLVGGTASPINPLAIL
ncbi:cyclase family protein [Nonomuraea sp. NPDC050310]|uniref:cyclase family protein n=1 Tax=Nonomuraea sp. NPDC050310 TaxID=3154935 RepID=UPI0033DE8CBC